MKTIICILVGIAVMGMLSLIGIVLHMLIMLFGAYVLLVIPTLIIAYYIGKLVYYHLW